MTTDPIAAAWALIKPLTGYTPSPWRKHGNGKQIVSSDAIIAPRVWGAVKANTRLIAAAPDLRDMVATLAAALEAERAKVAAAYEAAADESPCCPCCQDAIRALTPTDAQATLDRMLAEARLEGWRAGRDAAADAMQPALRSMLSRGQAAATIRALPEPKEAGHE